MLPTTTTSLIRQVRNQLKEDNKNSIDDQEVIDALNRGQNHGVDVLTRNYVYPYLETITVNVDDSGMFDLPEDIMSNRIVNIECDTNKTNVNNTNLTKLNYKDRARFRGNKTFYSQYPQFYYVSGRKAEVYPARPATLYIYYLREPAAIVSDAGFIHDVVSKTTINRTTDSSASLISSLSYTIGGSLVLSSSDAPSLMTSLEAFMQSSPVVDYEYTDSLGFNRILRVSNATISYDWVGSDVVISGLFSISFDEGQSYSAASINISTSDVVSVFESQVGEDVIDYIMIKDYNNSIIKVDDSYDYASYINVCDAQTGEIKVGFQSDPSSESDGTTGLYKLYPRVPIRSSVLNQPVSDIVNQPITDIAFEADDFVCGIKGTCVLQYDISLENFIIQYAVNEINRSLGHDAQLEKQMLDEFEQTIKRTYINHDNTMRVNNNSNKWTKGRWRLNRR